MSRYLATTVTSTQTLNASGDSPFYILFDGAIILAPGTANGGDGVFGAGSSLSVSNDGTISATAYGIDLGASASITNQGHIYGGLAGIYLPDGGYVDNSAGAYIGGAYDGAIFSRSEITVTNAGTINGAIQGEFRPVYVTNLASGSAARDPW